MSEENMLNLLVVDDEAAMRSLLRDSLAASGHRVFEAEHGRKALEILRTEPVDLVVTDLKMEGMSGIELVKAMKAEGIKAGIYVLTGHATLESAMEAMRLGALDVIQKPINMSELTAKIEEFLQHRAEKGASAQTPPKFTSAAAAAKKVEVRPVELSPMEPRLPEEGDENMDRILDIPVMATVRLGTAKLQIADLLKLGAGSVIELDRHAGEAVDLFINDKLVAHGEVVVVNDTFGLRITSVVDPQQRIKSLA